MSDEEKTMDPLEKQAHQLSVKLIRAICEDDAPDMAICLAISFISQELLRSSAGGSEKRCEVRKVLLYGAFSKPEKLSERKHLVEIAWSILLALGHKEPETALAVSQMMEKMASTGIRESLGEEQLAQAKQRAQKMADSVTIKEKVGQ